MYARCMHDVCTMYARCMHDVCTMYARCMHDVCTMYARCMHDGFHSVRTVSTHLLGFMQGYEPAAQSVAALPPELTEGGHVALVMVAGLMQPLERLLLSGAPWQLAHVLRRTRAGRARWWQRQAGRQRRSGGACSDRRGGGGGRSGSDGGGCGGGGRGPDVLRLRLTLGVGLDLADRLRNLVVRPTTRVVDVLRGAPRSASRDALWRVVWCPRCALPRLYSLCCVAPGTVPPCRHI
jgi:hypothetical protein